MNREAKWFMTVESLLDYGKVHPLFIEKEPKYSAFNKISSLYSELSAGVHGRTVKDLEMRAALKKIAYDQAAATRHANWIESAAEATNFILAVLHHLQMDNFEQEDKRMILRSMPTLARSIWHEHE